MTYDPLASAFATLGLSRDAPSVAVKRRYRALVRRWHPDQFFNDPQGIADATLMLKAINHAYSTILEHRSAGRATPARDGSSLQNELSRSIDGRLTQIQIDEIVKAIRHSESLLEVAFNDDIAGWRSRAASLTLVVGYAAVAWKSGETVRVLVAFILPLLCVWFPDMMGEHIGGRITKPSPAYLVWLFGWVVLTVPVLALGIIWLRS